MTSYAVIGASRGIGLEYVRQLAAKPGSTVFAVVRSAAKSTHLQAAVKNLKNVHVLEADVTDYASLEKAAKQVAAVTGGKLDYLIHSAARMEAEAILRASRTSAAHMDELDADFITTFKINTLGVIHSITAFLPLLRTGLTKKIVVISTGSGDPKTVRKSRQVDMAAYGIAKAGALIATTKYALKLQDEGFVVVAVNPGLVDNSGTVGENGDPSIHAAFEQLSDLWYKNVGVPIELETPEQSVSAQIKLIDGLKPSDNGLFLEHNGGESGV
ncbi:NAD-P-binding protein [Cerioporus squamosus]|nr:NAD-P-binding protein [Cerioporus squamosus]